MNYDIISNDSGVLSVNALSCRVSLISIARIIFFSLDRQGECAFSRRKQEL